MVLGGASLDAKFFVTKVLHFLLSPTLDRGYICGYAVKLFSVTTEQTAGEIGSDAEKFSLSEEKIKGI